MSSFKTTITKGKYVSQPKALGTWYAQVTSRKVERHMPKPVPPIKRKQSSIIRRDKEGRIHHVA